MFWGLNLKANRKYTQTTSKSFHISQAALDADTTNGGANQIFITCDNQKFLVCTLRKDVCEQVMLDYNFAEGDEISFQTKGDGSVSLTGYIVENDMMDYMNGDESSASEEEEVEAEVETDLRSAINMKKKAKKEIEKAPVANEDEDDDDDEDDEDFEIDATAAADLEDDDEDDDDDESEDDDDEENEEGDDDGDEEEDEDEEDDEGDELPTKKAKLEKVQQKQNGLAKQNDAPAKKKQKNKDKQPTQKQEQQKQPKQGGGQRTLSGGVKVEDIRVGNGPEVKAGKRAVVYYEGRLQTNNKVFDSLKQGSGFKFSVGRGEVIKGWDVGVSGMKVGGKRRITCPPHMAYGARGSPPAIPPNSTLVFEVELKGVQ